MTPIIERVGKYVIERTEVGTIYITREGCEGHVYAKTMEEARRYAKERSR